MDEPTAMLPPVSTVPLTELLEGGPLPLAKGLELLGVIAEQVAQLHAQTRSHGLLTSQVIRVSVFESGPPVVVLSEPDDATRDMSEGADQWSLGVLTFQVLAGRYPKPNEALRDALPDAPAALDKLVSRLMAARPLDRLGAAAAHRQFLDLAATAADPKVKAAAPLAAPPQLKRPSVPIGDDATELRASPSKGQKAAANPFADDEATAMVQPRSTAPMPPPADDEKTQFEPVKRHKRAKPTEQMEPLPPPVMTPEHTPMEPETTASGFEPSRSDLPGNTGDGLVEPRLKPPPPRRKRRDPAEHTPLSELMRVAKQQPPWIWGALGVGLAFFVLLLIALAR